MLECSCCCSSVTVKVSTLCCRKPLMMGALRWLLHAQDSALSVLERQLCQCVCVLQNVTPKDEAVFDEKVSSKDTLPSHTLGFFKHEFGGDGKMKDTWFLRQFSKDEAARKVIPSGLHLHSATVPVVTSKVRDDLYLCQL